MFTKQALAGLVLLLAGVQAACAQPTTPQTGPRNVILFVADGCGPASFTLARDFVRYRGGDGLALDGLLTGTLRTFSTSSRVTDSAAAATAFACGVKSYNGAIAVDTLRRPLATLLEAAEARGMATGLVATSRITHATPAAFAAHVPDRDQEADIAAQMITRGIDVLFGGGRDFFVPEAAGGRRSDGRNLLDEAAAEGYRLVDTRAGFDVARQTPVVGLFAGSHLAYEIDRDAAQEPSLAEMTARAIDLLDDDPEGFFLMVEGSRIDHAGHDNDAAAHLHEVLAFDAAVAAALAFARADGQTLLVSTSDHETGGLSLGRNVDGQAVYDWQPAVLAPIRASLERMGEIGYDRQMPPCDVLRREADITCTDEEAAQFARALAGQGTLAAVAAEAVSRRAVLGWTTGGHTAVDVNLYAFGPGRARFVGHHDNTAVGILLADLLGFDLPALTAALQAAPQPTH